MDIAYSVAGVPIRLTHERWFHIVENHDEMAGHYETVLSTLEDPDWLLSSFGGSKVAVRSLGRRRYLMVVYKELSDEDGFVITAYQARRLDRRRLTWRKT